MIGEMIQRARKRVGMTLAELGEKIGRSSSTMSLIENDQKVNGLCPGDMVTISDALHDTHLLSEYCDACPVRNRILIRKFPPLNAILPGAHVSIIKVNQKLAEAAESLAVMLPKMLRQGFQDDPDFREYRNGAIIKILDVSRGTEILKDQLVSHGIVTMDEWRLLMEMQQRLCEEKGHHVPDGERR